jgi:hypothetical protein
MFAEYEVTVYNGSKRPAGRIMVSADTAKEAKVKAREKLVKQGVEYTKLTAKGYW